MNHPYRNYSEEHICSIISEIEMAIDAGTASMADYGQLAQLEDELEAREWV